MASLPDYVAAAKPVPQNARAPWHKNIAPTYAGIMLWFVFWKGMVSGSPTPGGTLAAGVAVAVLGVIIGALICHFGTYLVPGLLGQKTGLPLYVVGTSTYGVKGGFIMPGFLMGCLQFGWLAVNAFFTIKLICNCFDIAPEANDAAIFTPNVLHALMAIAYILLAVFIGLKGIQYVAKVATYMPLIPFVILIILLVKTAGGLGDFSQEGIKATADKAVVAKTEAKAEAEAALAAATTDDEKAEADKEVTKATKNLEAAENVAKKDPLDGLGVLLLLPGIIVGFFATAGAAGVDFGMNSRDSADVQAGGLAGIVGATVFAGGAAVLIVAGAYGAGLIPAAEVGQLDAVEVMKVIFQQNEFLGLTADKWLLFLLAVSAFAPACFPAFIAANSFKTTMPNVNPWISVGLGTLCAIALAVSGWAGQAEAVFLVIGASFGPICGAMLADFLLSGGKWAGPRAAFNPAGWISWAVGFVVGAIDLVADKAEIPEIAVGVPCPSVAALIVGFVLYLVLAKAGLESAKLEMPPTTQE